ncbi:19047_t:CDS:2, partial [Racocetra fulgida]
DEGFDYEEFIYYLKREIKGYDAVRYCYLNVEKLREGYANYLRLKEIHDEDRWNGHGFTIEEIEQWIKKGLFPNEYDLANYLKNRGYNPEQEFDLSNLNDSDYCVWLRDTKKVNAEWVMYNNEENEKLKNSYWKFGLCEECQQPKTGESFCPCSFQL